MEHHHFALSGDMYFIMLWHTFKSWYNKYDVTLLADLRSPVYFYNGVQYILNSIRWYVAVVYQSDN